MEIQDRVGELLLVGFAGQELDSTLAGQILGLRPAGLIFFERNIVSPGQLARLSRDVQVLALKNLGRPLLLAVDQEGGPVARLPRPFARLPAAAALGKDNCQMVTHYAEIAALQIRLVGLNLNLAPVLDVNSRAERGLMEQRSFGGDPYLVSRCGVAALSAMQAQGVMATAKHFPGLGRARQDPHRHLPAVEASKEELSGCDLLPFQAAIRAGVSCVMSSHTLYSALDPELPATFSPAILTGLLRAELGFAGVVITDDLEMGAVVEQFSPEEAAVAALKAGTDLLLICHSLEKMERAAEAIRRALDAGVLDPGRLAQSVARVEWLRGKYLRPLNLADPAALSAYFSP